MKGKPNSEPTPAPRPLTLSTLAGRASVLEVIRAAANATGATGIGAVLSYNEGRGEPRR